MEALWFGLHLASYLLSCFQCGLIILDMNFLVAESQRQADRSLSWLLKPDRGTPSLFRGAGLFLEDFYSASF